MVQTGEPPLHGISVQNITRGATDVLVALVQRVLYTGCILLYNKMLVQDTVHVQIDMHENSKIQHSISLRKCVVSNVVY